MDTMVISGGSSGIGEACSRKFLSAGYKVFNLDLKNNSELAQYTDYTWVATDVCSNNGISDALKSVKQLNTLIVCAGVHLSAKITDTTDEELLHIVNLNLLGAFRLIKYALPLMQKPSSIITIGSDQYTIAKPNSAAYGMTKAALAQLTKNVALDYAASGIRANCIGAGTIDTPLYRNAINKYAQKSGIPLKQIEDEEASMQPLGRIGLAEEIAELAFYLAGDKSGFITGAYLPVDGGYTCK